MNSLNWSGKNKKEERSSRVFTPNIYRKPIVKEEDRDKEVKKEVSYEVPVNYTPGSNSASDTSLDYNSKEPVYSVPVHEMEDIIAKESMLSKIRERYESEISEYENKQKQLDGLRAKFAEQEKDLNNKCAILKSAARKAEKSVPREEKEKLEKELNEFEKRRSEFTIRVKEFEDSRVDYEKEISLYPQKMEELSSLRSAYEKDLEEYSQKRSELDERCRELEEKLSAGEEISIDLNDTKCSAAIDVIRSSYYGELKELNRKRADLQTLRSELDDEESLLIKKRSSMGEIKEQIDKEISDLGTRSEELETSIARHEEKVKLHKENEIALQDEIKELEERRSELEAEDEKLRSKHDENVKLHKEKELAFQEEMKSLEMRKAELESEDEALKARREENKELEEEMHNFLEETENKKKELEEMIQKTNEEIGTHVTIHRQNLDIRKLNNKLEKQAIYIQSLENSVSQLKKSLEEARSDVEKNEVFAQILKNNLKIMK